MAARRPATLPRKGLARGERILDWMGSEELASNIFRAAQTTAKLKREGTDSKADANKTHFTVGREVRDTVSRAWTARCLKTCPRQNNRSFPG